MTCFKPEGALLPTAQNARILGSASMLKEACRNGTLVEGRAVLCDSEHDLHVDLGCMQGIIPKNEGAVGIEDGSVRDIALIARVNKAVIFRIKDFSVNQKGETYAILSRREVQRECMDEYLSTLRCGDIIDACVTHMEPFGAFCDVGAGISALLPIDSISVSRIPHPNARFSTGQNIRAVVKSHDEFGRLTLTHRELLGTWEENALSLKAGETVPGIVRSVEKYGIFVELKPNLAGLAEYCDGVQVGDHASVYIKSIMPQRMKIKLVIVDSFSADYPPSPIRYFTEKTHIDRWVYSPEGCEKLVETVFSD